MTRSCVRTTPEFEVSGPQRGWRTWPWLRIGKTGGTALWILLTPVEIYFIVHYLTLRQFFSYNGKGMAVGIGFTVAVLGITSIWSWVRLRRERRLWRARMAAGAGVLPPDAAGRDATPDEVAEARAWLARDRGKS